MSSPPRLRTVLTLRDLVLFHIVAIVGLRWYLTAARIGPASIALWGLAVLAFFLPQGIAVTALARRSPEEGGVYVWTRDAFGPFHGFLCGWSYWVNNLTYFPTLVLFVMGNAGFLFGLGSVTGAESSWPHVGVSCGILWAAVLLNVVGAGTGRWLHNVGALATWIVTAILVVLAAVVWTRPDAASTLAAGAGDRSGIGSLAFFSTLCFALAGLELAPSMAGEVRDPARTIPRSIFWAAPAIALTYILGTLAVLAAFPGGGVDVVGGIVESVGRLGERVGLSLTRFVALLVVVTGLGGLGAWLAGSARIPFAIGIDRYLPAFLGRLHPRWGTPHWALILQGALATGFILASAAGATLEEAYLVLVDATIIVYFVPYLYLFAALLAHERRPLAGPPAKALYAGACGLLATGTAIAFAFVPPAGVSSPVAYAVKVTAQALALLAAGAVLYAVQRRRTAARQAR
jgi:amino acid transporter